MTDLEWLFIDGSSLIFRAFYGVPRTVRSPDGRPVNGVRGFIDMLARLLTDLRPHHIAVASDEAWRPSWRVDLLPQYKSHRAEEPVPPELEPQFPIIHEVLDAVGIDFVGVPDYEAEDVIASWVAQVAPGVRADIVSGDRDLFALVRGDEVRVLYPEKGGLASFDETEVERRYHVPGSRYADYAILRGDPSDGLPGLRGVGETTAAELVRRFGSVEGILQNAPLKEADRDYLERALRVVPPVRNIPISLPAGHRDAYPQADDVLEELSAKHGLKSPVKRLVAALSYVRTH
jgi:5'-3' exonuclease